MLSLKEFLGQAIGEASMCWSETPKGIFDSTKASKIVDNLIRNLEADNLFINHIQSHLKEGEKVICKICGKTAEEIINPTQTD